MSFLHRITASNILSFGEDGLDIELRPLNVLIGPNGSGKSNFIDLLLLCKYAPTDVQSVIRKGGGILEWRWKGAHIGSNSTFEVVVAPPLHKNQGIKHHITFGEEDGRFRLLDERIENDRPNDERYTDVMFYYRYHSGRPMVNIVLDNTNKGIRSERKLTKESIIPNLSVLAQLKDPSTYPELSYLANVYDRIAFYREWIFGRDAALRKPQPSDARTDRLEPDFTNLGIFLNGLRRYPKTKRQIIEYLQDLYDGLTDFEIEIVPGGYVQILFIEGDYTIPASRLSDGTLRYLCLLAILLDPTPPPLICIEEPEIGLHPDILPKIADLLIDASNRTQLIVTTHSDILIDALSEMPETVLVCEKHDGNTYIQRLEADKLTPWLEQYRLGTLWTKGEIGGNRW